ncbi:hypothetical protein Goarm_012779 [Gossypium armourianum]|uniref:Uncharacterized protein n=1 Tax=Gossypium armourianum TaxID=34283 RepID=A0A7J9J3Q2_9ROSI|nr:hypothetical protein [Gossypium armourianum]
MALEALNSPTPATVMPPFHFHSHTCTNFHCLDSFTKGKHSSGRVPRTTPPSRKNTLLSAFSCSLAALLTPPPLPFFTSTALRLQWINNLDSSAKFATRPSTLTRLWVATKPATALGGHKRLYYEGGAGTAKGITTSERSASTNTTNQRGFDLNLLALPEFSPSNLFVFGDDDEVESPHPSKKPRLVIRMPPKVEVN